MLRDTAQPIVTPERRPVKQRVALTGRNTTGPPWSYN